MRQNRSASLTRWGVVLAVALCGSLTVATPSESRSSDADLESAISTVEAYHDALATRDSVAARGLLADDAVILESGYSETLEEYLGHHLGADMEFSSGTSSTREILQAVVQGDAAWVAARSVTEGEFRGQAIRAAGAELMVLSRAGDGWKIRAIHWSSRRLGDSD